MSYSKSSAHTKSLKELMISKPLPSGKPESKLSKPKEKVHVYPRFTPTGKDVSSEQFRTLLLASRKMNNKGRVLPQVTPSKSLQIPYTKSTWKYSWAAMRHAPDEAMFMRLKNAGLDAYADPTMMMVRSNGTKRGLLNRMVKQICVKFILPSDKHIGNKINLLLPFRAVPDDYLRLKLDEDHPAFAKMNTQACAGLPYAFIPMDNNRLPKVSDTTTLRVDYNSSGHFWYNDKGEKQIVKDGDPIPLGKPMLIVQHALIWAKKIQRAVDEAESESAVAHKLQNFYATYPEMGVFLLKRKDEKNERKYFPPDLDNEDEAKEAKVRPYGCQPLPTRMFGMWAGNFVETFLKNFVEDPHSISAYHFSQFYGGAQRIYDFMNYHYEGRRNFWGLAYGDDQLWTVRLKGGHVLYLTPDVNAMDMNTRSDTIKTFYKWVKAGVPNLTDEMGKALIAHLCNAFVHRIHVDGAGIVEKSEALFSGVPLTTIINIHNSARIQYIVGEEFEARVERRDGARNSSESVG